ncbi:MAG: winged helix-turn-helix domain-containing protein [Thiotrichaceae bacterium]|nr:winged helix-turn-helix domain-containing protein [Thiotrichaceae bacterium]
MSDWLVDPPACSVIRGSESIHLEPKVMDLLVYMANNSAHVHSREELLENIWPTTIVSDEALTSAIIKLRKAFNDDAHHPKFIETLPKRGYRLIAEVNPLSRENETTTPGINKKTITGSSEILRNKKYWIVITLIVILFFVVSSLISKFSFQNIKAVKETTSHTSLPLPEKPSIAVLPFVNTGNNAEYSYFSDGITDDLITDLSKLSGLFVISRNSTFQYKGQSVDVKQVAKKLGVRFILDGSVRRNGNHVRVNTQLIDGLTGGQLWAERYDGDLQDVFKLQDQLTTKIISALSLQLTKQDQALLINDETSNAKAYDEYLKGSEYRWRVSRESFAQAEKHFQQALKLDPDYSRAHAALALIYWQAWLENWHTNSGSTIAGWVRARQELDAAMLNPTPLAHSIKSALLLHNRRYEQSIIEAKRSIELNPNSATGYLALAEALSFSGQPGEAILNAKKALRRDPNFPAPYLFVEGRALFDLQLFDDAIVTLKRAIAANPEDRNSMIVLIAALGKLGRLNEANEYYSHLNQILSKDRLPNFKFDKLKLKWPYKQKIDQDRLFEGLKLANIPEW